MNCGCDGNAPRRLEAFRCSGMEWGTYGSSYRLLLALTPYSAHRDFNTFHLVCHRVWRSKLSTYFSAGFPGRVPP